MLDNVNRTQFGLGLLAVLIAAAVSLTDAIQAGAGGALLLIGIGLIAVSGNWTRPAQTGTRHLGTLKRVTDRTPRCSIPVPHRPARMCRYGRVAHGYRSSYLVMSEASTCDANASRSPAPMSPTTT